MISCAALEKPGNWRLPGLALVFACALAPVIPLCLTAMHSNGGPWLGGGFGPSLARGLKVAGAVALAGLLAGLPCGVLAGLYRFPLRRFLLAILLLPLLVPSFLWALGISMARQTLGWNGESVLSGFSGCVLAFQSTAFPLVFFVTMAATRGISAGQVAAARLAGGDRRLFWLTAQNVLNASVLAALLAACASLSDPGPGQILGYQGAASQMLISFSAQYDFALAARQCLVLAIATLLVVLPVAVLLSPELAQGLLARDVHPPKPLGNQRMGWLTLAALSGVTLILIGLPVAGLVLPATSGLRLARALDEIGRTMGNTAWYGGLAAVTAISLGATAAICTGRQPRLAALLMAGLAVVFVLPPALGALGLVGAASKAPHALDPLLRGRFALGVWLGLRLFPVATILLLRRLGESSPSWAQAAAVHGMPLPVYATRVLLPWLAPAALVSATVVALLGIADVSSALLLHPPGDASLPLAIFSVMANAPESLVASLCLAYLGGAALVLAMASWFYRGRLKS